MLDKFFLVLALLSFSFISSANDVYIIKNVKISANNKVASIARNTAIENGQLKAFNMLVKLHYPAAEDKIELLDKDEIFDTIEGIELSQEKRSKNIYAAKMKVKFSREYVDNLMGNFGVKFSEAPKSIQDQKPDQKPIEQTLDAVVTPLTNIHMSSLVIPVFEQSGKYYGLEDENVWLNAWQNKLKNSNSNKFVLPLGDLEDLPLINKDILNKNLIELAPLFDKYNVNNLVLYKLVDNKDDQQHYISSKISYINKYHYSWKQYNFKNIGGTNLALLLNKSTENLEDFPFNNAQNDSFNYPEEIEIIDPEIITIEFKTNKTSDWINLEQILNGIRYVSNVNLKQVNAQYYSFSMTYNIELTVLEKILKQYNFILEENSKNDTEDSFTLTKDILHAK